MKVKLIKDWIPYWNSNKVLEKGLVLGVTPELGREMIEDEIAVEISYTGRIEEETEEEEPQIMKPKKRGNKKKLNIKL